MKGSVVATFVVLLLLHPCAPLWPVASAVGRNRTEDLPIVFPDDDNVASDATTLTTRTARRLADPPFGRSKGVSESARRVLDSGAYCTKKKEATVETGAPQGVAEGTVVLRRKLAIDRFARLSRGK